MRLSDDGVNKMRGMMKQVAKNAVSDNISSYQRPQGKLGLEVPHDDQAVVPELPQLAEKFVHDCSRQVEVTVRESLDLARVSIQIDQRNVVPQICPEKTARRGCCRCRGRGRDRLTLR